MALFGHRRSGLRNESLSETHLDEWPEECICRKLNMDYKEVVRSDGRSGGLLLFWKKEIVVSLRYKTKNYIDVYIGNNQQDICHFNGVYGEPSGRISI